MVKKEIKVRVVHLARSTGEWSTYSVTSGPPVYLGWSTGHAISGPLSQGFFWVLALPSGAWGVRFG